MDDLDAALAHHRSGRLDDAEALYRRVLATRPDDPEALHLLGMLCHQAGRNDEALPLLRRSVETAPAAAQFHGNLGGVLTKLGATAEAVGHLRRAVALAPQSPETHNNLAVALEALGELEAAESSSREALRLRPQYAEALNNLANVLRKRGQLSEAVRQYRLALALTPGRAELWGNLAAALTDLARHDEAIACHRRAAALAPADALLHSRLLFDLHYSHGDDPELLHAEHQTWARRHVRAAPAAPFPNDPHPDRPLRVGYVSPDFRDHPVSRFFEPILDRADPGRTQAFLYSDVVEPDHVTDRLRARADAWRSVPGRSDEQLVELVREDRIDILVDLAGHMGAHRLTAFARRAAPVQMTYLGYPDTTGVPAMDYRITDSRHDPPGATERYHAEQFLRLDPCCWCYRPDADAPADAGPLPARARGHVTFGVLNKSAKITAPVARLWARVLDATPGSRLMVLGSVVDELGELLEENGVPRARVDFVPRLAPRDYLRLYADVDVALDTFPYNGHTTTCDALWMGVPTVTLAGRTHVSRAGLSVLRAVGLEEMVAHTPDGYVTIATRLAHDLSALASLRDALRGRVDDSPLRDEVGFAARLCGAYRATWRAWCAAASRRA
jgi:protein O-GlcNAc transferase